MIDVVSAYYQNEQLTRSFLDNIGHKIILVNAGSDPLDHPNIKKRIDLKENKSFSNSMNTGIKQSRSDYVCVIGNDVFPEGDWLERLVKRAKETGAFITSPINDMANLPMYRLEKVGDYYEAEMFPAVCWLISRECLDKVGLFDEQFLIGCYEDDDYCKRVLQVGGKIVVDPSVNVRHLVSQTFKQFDMARVMEENRAKFEAKWKT